MADIKRVFFCRCGHHKLDHDTQIGTATIGYCVGSLHCYCQKYVEDYLTPANWYLINVEEFFDDYVEK